MCPSHDDVGGFSSDRDAPRRYDKFVDEWSDEPYWVHRETQVTVWDEPNVEALLPPGMAAKFPERLVIEDERTWLRIKDEQAEAKRMELKDCLLYTSPSPRD